MVSPRTTQLFAFIISDLLGLWATCIFFFFSLKIMMSLKVIHTESFYVYFLEMAK